jgi:hypothetical protein
MPHDSGNSFRLFLGKPGSVVVVILASLLSFALGGACRASAGPDGGQARKGGPAEGAEVTFPPLLPRGQDVATDRSDDFLRPPASLKTDVAVARTPPAVDFLFYPGQTYPGQPWSNWGDGLATAGKYYSSIGDHRAIGAKDQGPYGTGTALVVEYDPGTRSFRTLVDTSRTLALPEGHYTPGKIHSRLDMGRDGRLYFSTHRGAEKSAIDRYHYRGDWILRCDPRSGAVDVVVHGPVPRHSIPCGILDPERLIFYGGTAAGPDSERQVIQFFAYDVKNRELLYSGPGGPARYLFLARSSGRVYFVPGADEGFLMRFDPAVGGPPVKVGGPIGVRAATEETPGGYVYTVSSGQRAGDADLWSFDTRTEAIARIGSAAVGTEAYVAAIDADPTGRYLYYIPGAHGSSDRDGSPVVQFDVRTARKKVIAFLHPFYRDRYGLTLKGTYSAVVSPEGDILYVTWNVSRGGRNWDCCGLTAIHIPESERQP